MPTSTLNPTGVGSFTTWANVGGASKTASVTPPDDADSSYVTLTGLTGTSRQSFVMADLPASAGSVVSHVATGRIRRATTGTLTNTKVFIANGSGAFITDGASSQPGTSYADRNETNLARPDGGTMTPTALNGCEVGVGNSGVGANEEVRCTTVRWSSVVWLSNDLFVTVLELLGPAVLGSSFLLKDAIAAAFAMSRLPLRPTILTGPEVLQLYRRLREERHRRTFVVGASPRVARPALALPLLAAAAVR